MRGRALLALLAVIVLTAASPVREAETYCVGGYDGTPPHVVAACNQPEVRARHRAWHRHAWVRNDEACFICYDREDDTCVNRFLAAHPDFRRVNEFDCARAFGEQHRGRSLLKHVIDGQPVAPPPPPPPTVLEARMERLSPGPYTAGDTVTMVGALRDEKGGLRPLVGGRFRVTDASGQTTEHPGTVRPDGTVEAAFALPPSSSARIEFLPVPPSLAPGESLRAAASEARALKVEVCGFRARVVQPETGAALVSGQSMVLGARLFDAAGQVPVPTPPAGLSLAFTVQVEDAPALTLPADAGLSATWTPPASPQPREVRLSAGGRAGERVVCPAPEVSATVSDLGLGFDTSELPRVCYVGLPCRGTVRLVRPAPGPGRQRVDTLLADPQAVVRVLDNQVERSREPPRADDRYPFDATYPEAGAASWSLVLDTPRGSFPMPTHEVRIRPALALKLVGALDFGTVPAGAAVDAACQKLDFRASRGADAQRWRLLAEGLEGCQARPVLRFVNALGQVDTRALGDGVDIDALDPRRLELDVCLEVPRCRGEVSPASAVLRVVPLTPEFKDQAAAVGLRWKVEGRGPLGCHGVWVWPVLGLFGLGLVVIGFTRPARFPPGASIRVAGSERGIRQSSAILLRGCPGSGPGFYRDARLGLHAGGEVKGRVRHAAILLRATRGGGVELAGPGPLEQQDRRTLKWEPVTDLSRGHVPSSAVLYRAGDTYFKVEH